MNLATAVIGPLLVPECRRQARRGWVLILRALAATAMALPAMAAVWWCWMSSKVDPFYRPDALFPITLAIVEGLLIAVALVLSPAVLAGSLAGEKERGSIGLLLSTSVDAREIVLGRMFGKLSLVAAINLAGWPFLLAFAVLCDCSFAIQLVLLALPFVVSFGAGGLAIAASAVASKGRNALMTIYIAEVLLLLLPLLGMIPGMRGLAPWLGAMNPFDMTATMLEAGTALSALPTLALWFAVGVLGVTFASWRLRPSFLALVGGKSRGLTRRGSIPAVDEARPMLWKELHIERAAALGWFGRILGGIIFLYLVAGSLVLAAIGLWSLVVSRDTNQFDAITETMGRMFDAPSLLFSWLIQLTVGLRAAVAISSERERGTWDALLTSPLSGRDIIVGKLWGSLYSMRWLLCGTLLAWTMTLLFGAMRPGDFAAVLGQTIVASMFVAAVGVRTSLSTGTATKAMSLTVGIWLGTYLLVMLVSGIVMLVLMLLWLIGWMFASGMGLIDPTRRLWMPTALGDPIWRILVGSIYLGLTASIVGEARSRFDEIAGRMRGDGQERPKVRFFGPSQAEPHDPPSSADKARDPVADLA